MDQIKEKNTNLGNGLKIPTYFDKRKNKQMNYQLRDLNDDQFHIAYYILKKIREWLNLPNLPKEEQQKFKPLRMTVMGQGGTGKSRLINTLVSVLRTMFQNNDSVHVAAPTGAAAFSVGGQTLHRLFCVKTTNGAKNLSTSEEEYLGNLLKSTIALFFDERSLISQSALGSSEINISKVAHNGGHESEDCGGVPIVVIFGDDYQLPSIEPGAIDSFSSCKGEMMGKSTNGRQQFLLLGKTVMELKQIMRQQEHEIEFMNILCRIRLGEATNEDISTLMSLHLDHHDFSKEEVDEIRKKAMYIYANKKPMQEHNLKKLREEHSPENPVARIHATTLNNGKKYRGATKHFGRKNQANAIPSVVNICRGAKVQITGKNFEPDWGLYNGSIGTVKEIVFEENQHPLDGCHPLYVIVDFPQYCGPAWMKENPKWVPIPTIELNCEKHCCQVRYIPLSLAYAKTCHTFQGQTVGKNCPIECIIVQPGTRDFEGKCPGLFYVFLSRATDIGTEGNRGTSAIFFDTNEMNRDRIRDLTHSLTTGKEYSKVTKRNIWNNYLREHIVEITINAEDKERIINWAESTKITEANVSKIIDSYAWRTSGNVTSF